jgi:hypothetical protein
MKTLIARYKRQNTKGLKGVLKIISEEKTHAKWYIQYLFLKYVKYKLINY